MDFEAQLKDLLDKRSRRLGVWFSHANVQHHYQLALSFPRPQTLLNFDGLGGIMIAKDFDVGQELIALRDSWDDIQAVIGHAVGSGHGKPEIGKWVVQQRRLDGGVCRESVVADDNEARKLFHKWRTGSRQAHCLTIDQALARRAELVAQE